MERSRKKWYGSWWFLLLLVCAIALISWLLIDDGWLERQSGINL